VRRAGPLELQMPADPAPAPDVNWRAAEAWHLHAVHEDSEDALNLETGWAAPGVNTWGPRDVGSVSGTGIALGYSCDDLAAVRVAEQAVWNRPQWYNLEHWLRQIRYAVAAWDMTHEAKFARRLIAYDLFATGQVSDDPATIHLDDPSWDPFTLAQFHAKAARAPHVGLGYPFNARAVGEVAYGRAMRHAVDRSCERWWGLLLLRTCELAAIPGTGQVSADGANGAHQIPVVYLFHQGLLVHGVLALCYRLGAPVPRWVLEWMDAVEALPRVSYYGVPSPLKFCYSVDGVLVPEVSEIQGGDPGFAYWSSNCVALAKLLPAERDHWLRRAAKIGPVLDTDQNSRKLSMLYRGEVQNP